MDKLNATIKNEPNKVTAIVLAAGLFLSPMLYFEALFHQSELPRYVLISIIAIIVSTLLIVKLWRDQTRYIWHPINIAIIIFSVITAVSGLWALDKGGYYLSIMPFISLIIIYFVATHLHRHTILLLSITLIAALYAAIIGLLQNYHMDPFDFYDASIMASTFIYKNHAALYFDLIIPASLSLILIIKNTWIRWGITITCAICLSFLLETHTRGSWLALGITLITVAIFITIKKSQLTSIIHALHKTRFELLTVILITSAITLSPGQMDESWSRDSYHGEEVLDTSSSIRLSIYKNSLTMLMENPLGVGFGSFWKGFREYTNYPEIIPHTNANIIIYRAHSEPLQFFLELGLFGGVLVLFIFFYLMNIGVRTILTIENTTHKILCLGITASLLTSALHGVVDFPLHKPSSALQFWVLTGLLIGFSNSQVQDNIPLDIKHKKASLILFGLLVLIVTLLSVRLYLSHIPGSIHHKNAVLAMKSDCDTASAEIEASLSDSPYYFRTHNSRVDIYFKCVKDNKKILPILNQELEIDDSNVKAMIRRGYIHLENQNFEAAYKDFKRVDRLLPHKAYGHYGVAQTLLSSGNTREGIIELNIVIKNHPEFDDAKKQLQDAEKFIEQRKPR